MHWFQLAHSPITEEFKECGALQTEYIYYTYGSRYMDNSDIADLVQPYKATLKVNEFMYFEVIFRVAQ